MTTPQKLIPLALLLLATPLYPLTLVNDTFDIGASPTVGDDLDDADDTAWTGITGTTVSLNTTGALGSGNALQGTVGGNSVNLLGTTFASQTLAAVGDSLSLSFDYRWVNATTSATDRTPVFGLYNSAGTAGVYTDDIGYNLQLINTAVTKQLRVYREPSGDNPLTGGGESQIGSQIDYVYDGAEARFTLTLTRIADSNSDEADDLRIDVSVVGTNSVSSALVDTAGMFTFDQFFLRSRATNYYLDNVLVEFTPASTIPEPGAFALLAGTVGIGLAATRRRR